VAYLPKHKILCTGDACVNGSFNFMGHSNSASWVTCLDGMQKLDVALVCPGHGKPARKDLLATQKRYFVDLRAEVKKGIDAKKPLADIAAGLDLPWYKEWTGVAAKDNKDNVKHVYDEMMGKIDHDKLGLSPAPLDWRAAPAGAAVASNDPRSR
jgi:glyoxylase-like metal-dependent hydrolase (beta-lactamase superfamily II)